MIYGIVLLIGLAAGYFIHDLRQARQLTAEACRRAAPGTPLEDFCQNFPKQDYKIIRNSEYILIVPKEVWAGITARGVEHDGRIITGAKTGFMD
ncbi:MAG: hypothetical protein MZV70_43520 [Desulfobacterales bacterium]|nr:hypothetical protein [Desulfobacterales bacterium]